MAKAKTKLTKKKPKKVNPLNLSDIKSGQLVGKIHDKTVEFVNQGETYSVDIRIKQLPFAKTQPLYKKLDDENDDSDDYISEWIAMSLVDEKGELQFTAEQVKNTFIQPLANAIFDAILGIDNLKKELAMLTEQIE